MLGDGGLTYGREGVSETYYTAHVIGGLYVAPLLSFVNNPGFNKDRSPLSFPVFASIWISEPARAIIGRNCGELLAPSFSARAGRRLPVLHVRSIRRFH